MADSWSHVTSSLETCLYATHDLVRVATRRHAHDWLRAKEIGGSLLLKQRLRFGASGLQPGSSLGDGLAAGGMMFNLRMNMAKELGGLFKRAVVLCQLI